MRFLICCKENTDCQNAIPIRLLNTLMRDTCLLLSMISYLSTLSIPKPFGRESRLMMGYRIIQMDG